VVGFGIQSTEGLVGQEIGEMGAELVKIGQPNRQSEEQNEEQYPREMAAVKVGAGEGHSKRNQVFPLKCIFLTSPIRYATKFMM
jgi:hypothetical protein